MLKKLCVVEAVSTFTLSVNKAVNRSISQSVSPLRKQAVNLSFRLVSSQSVSQPAVDLSSSVLTSESISQIINASVN